MSSQEEWIKADLLKCNVQLEDICSLDKLEESMAEKALSILLEYACYGQHIEGIELGQREIAKIPKTWLKSHLLAVVKNIKEYCVLHPNTLIVYNDGTVKTLKEEIDASYS